jgi:hypothetical protein
VLVTFPRVENRWLEDIQSAKQTNKKPTNKQKKLTNNKNKIAQNKTYSPTDF